ncbi:MAG: hypothetical protein JWS12_595 [Candidatus Saccharibacteria bacterium]|nr:hypothetical protein [Candidatus Saccharibacteria bacterium]
MPEVLISPPTAEHQLPVETLQPAAHEVGAVAITETVNAYHEINIGGNTYQTNLPKSVHPLEDTGSRLTQSLRPTELDKLPVGSFEISGTEPDYNDDGDKIERAVSRNITVKESEHGKVISADSFYRVWLGAQPDAAALMTALGYEVKSENGNTKILGVPTPDTVKRAAAKLGVDIAFFPDDDYILGRDYLQAYVDEKYPASLKKESIYEHDITDDHLTAMVLGGAPLKEALRDVSAQALQADQVTVDKCASNIDKFTATLRAVVSIHGELLGEPYGIEQGRRTLIETGALLGLSTETVGDILAVSQENGRKFGLTVKELA